MSDDRGDHLIPHFSAPVDIDRMDQLRCDPAALAKAAGHPRARQLRLNGLEPLLSEAGTLQWAPIDGGEGDLVLLGAAPDDVPLFVALNGTGSSAPLDRSLWGALSRLSATDAALYATARSVVDWHARHRFCAQCGRPTVMAKGGWQRNCAADGEGCGAQHFPRVDPVAIMLAEYEGKLLLGRQPRFPPKSFSALAGFVEPGESIEGAVARELFEEAGIRVRDVRYVASQPWPFPSSLMIGCWSRAEDDALTIDETEIEDARWFTRAEVTAAMAGEADAPFMAPPPMAIANTLLRWWLAQ